MNFIIYDITFFVLCTIFVVIFLYIKRANLQRQGLLYLYRTKLGLKIIEWTSKKYSKILKPLQYVIIASGYILMFSIVYLIGQLTYVYLTSPYLAKALKVPVLLPLIPYLPELFKLDFLPHFYFTYWIIILAIVAIPHEFAHGIFARLNKIKVQSTGFGFLGPFLAAFVEPDEKQMEKAKKFPQLAILAAGTFANILMAILFGLIMWLFFISAFSPAGVVFNTYSTAAINVSAITSIGGVSLSQFNISELNLSQPLIDVEIYNQTLYSSPIAIKDALTTKTPFILGYENTPAFRANLTGAIISIDDVQTKSRDALINQLSLHSPGDNVSIQTIDTNGKISSYNITLADKDGKPYIGVGISLPQRSGLSAWIYSILSTIKDPTIYYSSSIGNLGPFIFDLLWWIVLVSISVALMNMLPVGIFDGGRFFYLTVLGITKNKKFSEYAFKFMTWLFLAIVVLLMAKWVFAVL